MEKASLHEQNLARRASRPSSSVSSSSSAPGSPKASSSPRTASVTHHADIHDGHNPSTPSTSRREPTGPARPAASRPSASSSSSCDSSCSHSTGECDSDDSDGNSHGQTRSGAQTASVGESDDSEADPRGLTASVRYESKAPPPSAAKLTMSTSMSTKHRAVVAIEQAIVKMNAKPRGLATSYGLHVPSAVRGHQPATSNNKNTLVSSGKANMERSFLFRGSTRYSTSDSSTTDSSLTYQGGSCLPITLSTAYAYRRQSLFSKSHQSITKRFKRAPSKKMTLFALSMVNLTAYLTMSIIAPFFPYEASLKGMSGTSAGFVFSVYALVMMVASPLLGKLLPIVGLKFMLIAGIWFAGWSNILFGVLGDIEDVTTFTILCFVVRSVGAFGAASFSTASYTYIIHLFPDNVGLAFGLTETCVGVGMSLGPAVGGLLYGLGGYGLPFYVLGAFVLLNIPICWYFVKPIEAESLTGAENSRRGTGAPKATYFSILRNPKVIVVCLVLATATSTQGFLDPTIEPHFRQYGIEPQFVGLVFLVMSAAYAISSPGVGWFAGRLSNKSPLMVIGLIATSVGYLLLGPSQIIPVAPSFWISTSGMLILGLAYSFAFIPTFESILDTVIERGAPDDVVTYSLVSGLWSSVNSFGEVAGAGMGGVFLDYYNFKIGANAIALWTFVTALVLAVFYIVELACPSSCLRKSISQTSSSASGSTSSSDYVFGEKKKLATSRDYIFGANQINDANLLDQDYDESLSLLGLNEYKKKSKAWRRSFLLTI